DGPFMVPPVAGGWGAGGMPVEHGEEPTLSACLVPIGGMDVDVARSSGQLGGPPGSGGACRRPKWAATNATKLTSQHAPVNRNAMVKILLTVVVGTRSPKPTVSRVVIEK